MKKITIIILVLVALNVKANEEFNKFQQIKTKQVDSLSVVYFDEIKVAQKNYEKALLKADKKYTDSIKNIEDAEIKLLDKIKIKPNEK